MTGPHPSLATLYAQYRWQLYTCALAVTRCPDLAEDAIHEAFCRLLGRPLEADNLKAYAFRAVRNAAVDQLRGKVASSAELDDSIFDPSPNPADQAATDEERTRVAAALRELGPDERETIIQHLYAELTFREIAEIREAPLGTVVSWYRRGLARLRERLEET